MNEQKHKIINEDPGEEQNSPVDLEDEEPIDSEEEKEGPIDPEEEKKDSNFLAMFSYFGPLILIPLLTGEDDPFVRFHVKQGMIFLIIFLIIGFIVAIPNLAWLAVFMVFIGIGTFNTLQGWETPLPLFGKLEGKFKFLDELFS